MKRRSQRDAPDSGLGGLKNDVSRSRVGACPPPRNVAAKELAITNSLKSATLWGGVGGGAVVYT